MSDLGHPFLFGINPPFYDYEVSETECFLEFVCCLFGGGQAYLLKQQFFLVLV